MLGTWKIVKSITPKLHAVRCDLCGYETQRRSHKLKTHHRCPSIIDGTKYCYKCQDRKPLEFFHSDCTIKGGYSKLCKECYAERVGVTNFGYRPVARRKIRGSRRGRILGDTKLSSIEYFFQQRQYALKSRHKQHDHMKPYNLPDGYLYDQYQKQAGKCYYSGLPLDYTTPFSSQSISVDKLVSSNGYTVGNVVLCLNSINSMKMEMPEVEFKEFLRTAIPGFVAYTTG